MISQKMMAKKKHADNPRKRWVSNWRKLANRALHQTISDLETILAEEGLLHVGDGPPRATDKAFRLKFARKLGERTVWNLTRYASMARTRRKKLKKLTA